MATKPARADDPSHRSNTTSQLIRFPQPQTPETTPLAAILDSYYRTQAAHHRNLDKLKTSLTRWRDYFQAATVSDASSQQAIESFTHHLMVSGLNAQDMLHTLEIGRAAIDYACAEGWITCAPFARTARLGPAA